MNIKAIISFSIYVPLILGLCKVRTLEKFYTHFCIYLLAGAINETLYYLFKIDLHVRMQIQCLWHIVGTFIVALMIFDYQFKSRQFFLLFSLIVLIYLLEYVSQMDRTIQTSWAYIFSKLVLAIFSIPVVAREMGYDTNPFTNSKILILLPMIISFLVFDFLQIFYIFFYNESSKLFWLKTYNIFKIFIIISYISYSFAFLWAPKKEKYL